LPDANLFARHQVSALGAVKRNVRVLRQSTDPRAMAVLQCFTLHDGEMPRGLASALSDASSRPCRDVGRTIPRTPLQLILILKLRVKPWKVPLSEDPSCGDLVSTAKTTMLPAND
jgi:hypothetical protein